MLDETDKEAALENFKAFLTSLDPTQQKQSFEVTTKIGANTLPKAKIFFTAKAYIKMRSLVDTTSSEIGWHGIVEHNESGYFITDIIVYPQEVSGVTVTTDETEYMKWLYDFEDDVFNKIRMQGHSHVNMGVTPSGVDTTFYDATVAQLAKDDYYIFIITNKSGSTNAWIYDKAQNVIYDPEDIVIDVIFLNPTQTATKWTEEVKKVVKAKYAAYAAPAVKANYPAKSKYADVDKEYYFDGYSDTMKPYANATDEAIMNALGNRSGRGKNKGKNKNKNKNKNTDIIELGEDKWYTNENGVMIKI